MKRTAKDRLPGKVGRRTGWLWLALAGLVAALPLRAQTILSNQCYQLAVEPDGVVSVSEAGFPGQKFAPRFGVLVSDHDPKLELRWGDWGDPAQTHLYNVLTWFTGKPGEEKKTAKSKQHVEDGFDPNSDQSKNSDRTADLFKAAPMITLSASGAKVSGQTVEWSFPEGLDFALSATLELPPGQAEPVLSFRFTPRTEQWFSIGYLGAPEVEPAAMDEMWQPLLWQEKRFPNLPYLTEAGRCPLPAALVAAGGVTFGVVADPAELPFMPMPTMANSRFGVAVRNGNGRAQATLFAPILGGLGSRLKAGETFAFKLRLVVQSGRITDTYETLARRLFQFHDFRQNDGLGSLNRVFERAIDYAMGEWARFNDDLRGCAYDTDVPGAVKNVSSLHPLSVALVTDDEAIYTRRARPIMEYLMSREKFLFTVNPAIKGQGASAKLLGPCAPVSELAALYEISGRRSPCLLRFAEELYGKTRTLNLDAAVRGDIWQNALALYRATGEAAWLQKARAGADEYIQKRIDTPQKDFTDPAARGMFFWTSYAPNWMELYELFDVTKEPRYLEAARQGARRFAEFIWMCPTVPEGNVVVNEGGRAPIYRKSDKCPPIFLPEETVPAWRVSELGLTCESSGTSKGHRGILLATHGPWMLRLAQQTGDAFLHDIGRSAVVGRYTTFPGYHMNTARTTVYEKPDFPMRSTAQLNSTTSLHYNHIWPHIAMLLDYLAADAAYRSRGAIAFPAQFAEGYAYVQERVYGAQAGQFYGDSGVWLWMPKGLLSFDEPEVNYLAARKGRQLYLALMNQSAKPISPTLRLNEKLVRFTAGQTCETRVWSNNKPVKAAPINPASFSVTIPAKGLAALAIDGLEITPAFQSRLTGTSEPWKQDSAALDFGGLHALLLNLGPELMSAYVYLQSDASEFKQVTLHSTVGGKSSEQTDAAFPFEFTIPLPANAEQWEGWVEAVKPNGEVVKSKPIQLHR